MVSVVDCVMAWCVEGLGCVVSVVWYVWWRGGMSVLGCVVAWWGECVRLCGGVVG